MPKFWPIALLSVLNSKYKVRIEMEKERDRVSLISLFVGINLIGVETTDVWFGLYTETGRGPGNDGRFEFHQGTSKPQIKTGEPQLIRQSEAPEPTITYPQPYVPPVLYFAPDELPSSSRTHGKDPENDRMPGVVHDLQYIEDEIGEMRRRSSAVKMGHRGSIMGQRRRSSVQVWRGFILSF
jgi:hypothetical protein